MTCRVLREPHKIERSGLRGDGKERRFILLEITSSELPEKGDWEYLDEVAVSLLSTTNRKKGKKR